MRHRQKGKGIAKQPAAPYGDRRGERGITFVEVAMVMTILSVAGLCLVGSMTYSVKQNALNEESATAMFAARAILEQMKAADDLQELYTTFNSDPADDPLGTSTAVGNTFTVYELADTTVDRTTGRGDILFPTILDGESRTVLREDLDLPELGLPRDLNGDGVIDSENHAEDFRVLPVRIRVQWEGITGHREIKLTTVMYR